LNSFIELLPSLSDRDFEFTFVLPRNMATKVSGRLVGHRVEVVDSGGSISRDREIARIVRRLALEGTEIIHANSTSAARGAVLASLIARIPVLVHLRNSRLSRGERLFLRLSSLPPSKVKFVAVSKGAAEAAGSIAERCMIIPDPVSAGPRRSVRSLSAPPRIGIVANMLPTKGLDLFVDVSLLLRDQEITWEVFGSAGNEPITAPFVAEQRARLAGSNGAGTVLFRGIVPDLKAHLPELDLMLITSRRESFSRVAVESMLAGLPIVAPLIPGLSETIDGGRYAVTYEPENPADAARVLEGALAAYGEALDVSERARRWAESEFDPVAIGRRLEVIYAELRK
jgi:glycosyltransferase involved in cell wall biosynthesis